ncbi:hypothetical protein PENANT_c194G01948 [Penicillium antarcticum]|uniref:Uncharacterized protein n=2 Tax=Penicillium antarcticum TaxID=416450 RepID=A0A1V6PBT9_9EURO|nr:hypothetical protein PENANT_c194G01948 [Penicillium antarcticum]
MAMSLLTNFGDTSRAPCICDGLDEQSQKMDEYIQSNPTGHPEGYKLYTTKGDKSLEEAIIHALRDTLQFWAIWHGPLESHRWKHMYIAFTSCCDDICIPPQDLRSGAFRILGHTLTDVLQGLLSEGIHPNDVKKLKMPIWRESIGQYLEKVHPTVRDQPLGKTTMMTQFRMRTANGEGAALLALAARVTGPLSSYYDLVEFAGIGVCLSMDMTKEGLGILRGDPTEIVAGGVREQLKKEIHWLYARTMEFLGKQHHTPGFILPYLMDRYWERVTQTRAPTTTDWRRRIKSYRSL